MDERRPRGILTTGLGRFIFSATVTVLCSMAGSMLTWREGSDWVDANPLTAGPLASISLLPALAVLAPVAVGRVGAAAVSVLAGAVMVAFWWSFATSNSSTAAFVFVWGWLIGIPAAFGFAATRRARYVSGDSVT